MEETRERVRDALEEQEDVALAYVYGSVAEGHETDRSDLDVAVLLETDPESLDRAIDLNARLAEALDLPGERVDVTILNDAPLRLLHQVVSKGEPALVREESRRVAFEADVMDRYFDFKPMLERQARARRERFRGRAG